MAIAIVKGGIYTFTTIHPGYLGSLYEKALCGGELDYSTAKLLDSTIDAKQEAVKPYLPATASSKHTAYTYYSFTTQTGERKVFAAEWINITSIKEESEKFLEIRIGGADESNLPQIRNVLGLAGWNVVNLVP
jgi:hypothetical protein